MQWTRVNKRKTTLLLSNKYGKTIIPIFNELKNYKIDFRTKNLIMQMSKITRTTASSQDFVQLVSELDAELAIRDGEVHHFYHQFNGLEDIKHVVLVYVEGQAVGCGAIKKFDSESMEVKRMYVKEASRGQGLAVQILKALETWAKELNFTYCILETGINQPEAIRLYKKTGYQRTENYGQYAGVETSFCFKKTI